MLNKANRFSPEARERRAHRAEQGGGYLPPWATADHRLGGRLPGSKRSCRGVSGRFAPCSTRLNTFQQTGKPRRASSQVSGMLREGRHVARRSRVGYRARATRHGIGWHRSRSRRGRSRTSEAEGGGDREGGSCIKDAAATRDVVGICASQDRDDGNAVGVYRDGAPGTGPRARRARARQHHFP